MLKKVNNNTSVDILEYGRHTIHAELHGLQYIYDTLGAAFVDAVRIIAQCTGRVIVTGMGKSGHVGQKIAATMASTGTPAYFVHPAEASHGDLGMLSQDDVLLAISNSGESSELSDILLFADKYNLPIIAITRNAASTLGQIANIVLELPDCKEACPLERAPTTSTTATLALGDALAMSLMKMRNFGDTDFVNYHPGGKLGATLLTVKELLTKQWKEDLPLVPENAKMSEIVLAMTNGLKGHAGVITADGQLVGVISDGDLRRAFSAGDLNCVAETIMSRVPKTVRPSMRASELQDLMKENQISAVFIVDGNDCPIGLVHLQE